MRRRPYRNLLKYTVLLILCGRVWSTRHLINIRRNVDIVPQANPMLIPFCYTSSDRISSVFLHSLKKKKDVVKHEFSRKIALVRYIKFIISLVMQKT